MKELHQLRIAGQSFLTTLAALEKGAALHHFAGDINAPFDEPSLIDMDQQDVLENLVNSPNPLFDLQQMVNTYEPEHRSIAQIGLLTSLFSYMQRDVPEPTRRSENKPFGRRSFLAGIGAHVGTLALHDIHRHHHHMIGLRVIDPAHEVNTQVILLAGTPEDQAEVTAHAWQTLGDQFQLDFLKGEELLAALPERGENKMKKLVQAIVDDKTLQVTVPKPLTYRDAITDHDPRPFIPKHQQPRGYYKRRY